jgi:hypothetical protein
MAGWVSRLGYRETVPNVAWWEIETPAPGRFQEFHGALWGWTGQAGA